MRNTTIKASWGRDNCKIFASTKDFQSKQLNDTKVREIGWRTKAKIVQNWNGWRPQKKHMKCQPTHTDTQIQIHSHIVTTTTTSTTTTFIHAAQETTRRLVNFWIADSQKIQRILRYRYSYSCRYTDTDTSSSVLRWLAWRQFAVISCHVLIVKMSATYARICIYEIHLVSVNRFDWQWSC